MAQNNELNVNELEVLDSNNNQVAVGENAGQLAVNDIDFILHQAEQADKYVVAVKKIISASLSITNENDWVLIGGKPYLQESGATKVAKLFGISWKYISRTNTVDKDGYKTFHVLLNMWDRTQSIECEGSRSMRDDFFAKGKDGLKNPDEIKERDVLQSAVTNAINTGIKKLIPGLRGITVETLEGAGLDVNKVNGYTFKTGSNGGSDKRVAETSGIKCEMCGKAITQQVASFSEARFKQKLCMECQKKIPLEKPVAQVVKPEAQKPAQQKPAIDFFDIDNDKF